jgi:alpha-1,6-mannosyltransferase
MQLKTLHLTNAWHTRSGGIATFYKALMGAAERLERPLRLVVAGERDGREEVGRFGRIYYVRAPRALLNGDYRVVMPHRYIPRGTAIQRILREENPDIVEICDKYTLIYLGGLLRVKALPGLPMQPLVIGMSCERMDENMLAYVSGHERAERFCRWYMKWLYFPMCDHHIANSAHTAGELREASRGHKVRRGTWILPMGVEADRFHPSLRTESFRRALLERAGWPAGSRVLLYAGRLAPEKNAALIFETLSELLRRNCRDWRLLIAGSGIQREQFERECQANAPGMAHFLGHVTDRDELARLYANSDVFLHPNPREPFGIGPLEAMASGIPLVAPRSGGVVTYAGDSNAWLGAPEAGRFADLVQSITAGEEERAARTAAARQTAESYAWENVTDRFFALYDALHAARGGRSTHVPEPAFWSTPGDRYGRETGGAAIPTTPASGSIP